MMVVAHLFLLFILVVVLGEQQHLTKQEEDAYGNIISYLSSSSSGHLLVRSSIGGSSGKDDSSLSDEDNLWLIKDGYKHKTTPAEHKHSHGSHTPILTQQEIDAIPTSTEADASAHGGFHQKHIKPLLCATYLPRDSNGTESLENLRKNIHSTGRACEWAVVESGDGATHGSQLRATHYIHTLSSSVEDDLQLFTALYNISSLYHRIWLVDSQILLSTCDISKFFVLGEISFWPHPPPLVISPLLMTTTENQPEEEIFTKYPYLHHSYWFSRHEEKQSKHINSSSVIAFEVEALPISRAALGVESSFFRWFGKFIANETISGAGKPKENDDIITGLESILCTAAEMFGDLKAVKYPCAVISAPDTHVVLSEGYHGGDNHRRSIHKLNAFPSLEKINKMRGAYGPLYIGSDFASIYRQAFLNHDVHIRRPPRIALHITHIATNVINMHKLHRRMSLNITDINRQANFGKSIKREHVDTCDHRLHGMNPWNRRSHHHDDLPRLIAFYFPQFHKDPLNDKIWGEGFTDWDNIQRKPSFNRFGMPSLLPEDGNYDLLDVDVRRKHGCLALENGIDGFAYHHYWFYEEGKNNATLSAALDKMLEDNQPNIPFMFHWANHDWTNMWSGDTHLKDEQTLQKQHFPNPNQPADLARIKLHYKYLSKFFHHRNYILVHNKPIFMIYLAFTTRDNPPLNNLPPLLMKLNELAKMDGFDGIHFTRSTKQVLHSTEVPPDLVSGSRSSTSNLAFIPIWKDTDDFFDGDVFYPTAPEKQEAIITERRVPTMCITSGKVTKRGRPVYPGLVSYFDNLPRRSFQSSIHAHRSKHFPLHEIKFFVKDLINLIYFQTCCQMKEDKEKGGNFIFINAWNEWGEGMAIEPSKLFGTSMLDAINATKELLEMRLKESGNKRFCIDSHDFDYHYKTHDYVDVSNMMEDDFVERIIYSTHIKADIPNMTPHSYLVNAIDGEATNIEGIEDRRQISAYRDFIRDAYMGQHIHAAENTREKASHAKEKEQEKENTAGDSVDYKLLFKEAQKKLVEMTGLLSKKSSLSTATPTYAPTVQPSSTATPTLSTTNGSSKDKSLQQGKSEDMDDLGYKKLYEETRAKITKLREEKNRKKSLSLSAADNKFISKVLAVHGKIIGDENLQLIMPVDLAYPSLNLTSKDTMDIVSPTSKAEDKMPNLVTTASTTAPPTIVIGKTAEKKSGEMEMKGGGAIDVKEKDKAKRDSESLPRNGDDDFQEYYSPGK